MPGELDTDETALVIGVKSKMVLTGDSNSTPIMDALQSPNIPVTPDCDSEGGTKCCCGRSSCAWLRHNNAVVEDLERDVKTAGQLGQVCGAFLILLLDADSEASLSWTEKERRCYGLDLRKVAIGCPCKLPRKLG